MPTGADPITQELPADQEEQMTASLHAAIEANPGANDDEEEQQTPDKPDPNADAPTPESVTPAKPDPKPAPKPAAEKKPDPKPSDQAPPADDKTKPADDKKPLTIEELDKLKPGKGASKEDRIGFDRLRTIARDATKRAQELEAKTKELETAGTSAPALATRVQELEKENESLRKFEFMADPEKSGIIKQKYEKPIADANERVVELLTAARRSKGAIEAVKTKGVVGVASRGDWFNDPEWQKLPKDVQLDLQGAIDECFKLDKAKTEEINKASGDLEGFQKSKKEEIQKKFDADYQEFMDETKKIVETLPDWAKPIPEEGLKGEELKKAQAHNKYFHEVLVPMYDDAAANKGPRHTAKMAARVIVAHQLEIEAKEKDAKIEALEAELTALKEKDAQRKTMKRIPGSGPTPTPSQRSPGSLADLGTMESNMAEALRAHPTGQ